MKNGFFEEDEMIYHLNNKKVKDLNNNLRYLLKVLYGPLDEEEIVLCEKTKNFIKPDFIITYKGINKAVSQKSGKSEVIHETNIKDLILFLRSKGVSKQTQKTILLHHYGDGTLDGKGTPLEYSVVYHKLKGSIKLANEELNKDREFVVNFVVKYLLDGFTEDAIPVDALYHGDYEFGVVVTREQIIKHLYLKDYKYMNNLHIGPLQFRPHSRYSKKNEKRHHKTFIYWARLLPDIEYIAKRY